MHHGSHDEKSGAVISVTVCTSISLFNIQYSTTVARVFRESPGLLPFVAEGYRNK